MPRRRPNRLRPADLTADQVEEIGLPAVTAQALARLGQPGLEPETVALELQAWRDVVRQPVSILSGPLNDWIEFIGPSARAVLDEADQALNRRDGAPLRRELARLDAEFERKTRHNPLSDPRLPWWSRRWSH
ncbi:hypothetical protein [uncultured Friedmanniella sp.]|uniref:hypothetical protein n=1 Tax=uncultured Friedmanniella sp. TaxID=335381 RepID=UPI0035CAA47A